MVHDSMAQSNTGVGIMTTGAATVSRCSSTENSTDGVNAEDGSTVDACVCTNNIADGVHAGDSCTVTGNTSEGNTDDGIQAGTNCLVARNSCIANGPAGSGAGVYLPAFGCTVEDNSLMGNHYGLLANAANGSHLIIKNRAHANTVSFSIAAGNRFATAFTDPNSAGVTAMSNFAY
jgi:hypothetical protein